MSTHTQLPAAALARTFVETWATGDPEALAPLVADDIDYAGPLTSARGREAYLAEAGGFGRLVDALEVLHVATDDDGRGAAMFYRLTGSGFEPFVVAAHDRFDDDGRLAWSRLVFDTAKVRPPQQPATR